MRFSDALVELRDGERICRSGWNGKGMWLCLVEHWECVLGEPEDGPEVPVLPWRALPWIGMKTADDGFVPWLASQTDILAEDWEVVACS